MRAALVTTHWHDPWSEHDLAVRRVAGAVACFAELDVFVPGTAETVRKPYAAVRLISYQARPADEGRAAALQQALFGPSSFQSTATCVCHNEMVQQFARDLPRSLQWSALASRGSYSAELSGLLSTREYDLVLFAGCSEVTYTGMLSLPPTTPIALLPMMTGDPVEWIDLLDEVFERADAILVFTETEVALLAARAAAAVDKVTKIGFVVRVHELVHGNDPHGYEVADRIVIVSDWRDPALFEELRPWLARAATDFPQVEFRPLGPGAAALPFPYSTPLSEGQLDTWRWMARSLAALDPSHHHLLGRSALEALQYGVPILVPDDGGASREHADHGDGGLWYRAAEDLAACITRLCNDSATRQELAAHGHAYAQETYGDPKAFIGLVTDAIRAVAD